jgi:hypothetical protein
MTSKLKVLLLFFGVRLFGAVVRSSCSIVVNLVNSQYKVLFCSGIAGGAYQE